MLVVKVTGRTDFRAVAHARHVSQAAAHLAQHASAAASSPSSARCSSDDGAGASSSAAAPPDVDALVSWLWQPAAAEEGGGGGESPPLPLPGLLLHGPGAAGVWARLWERWAAVAGGAVHEAWLDGPFGRKLWVPCALAGRPAASTGDSGGAGAVPAAARFAFAQLAGQRRLRQGVDRGGALGPADALALAAAFPLLFVGDVPQLGAAPPPPPPPAPLAAAEAAQLAGPSAGGDVGLQRRRRRRAVNWQAVRDEARRLVTLVDVVYDERARRGGRLVLAAPCPAEELLLPLLRAAQRQASSALALWVGRGVRG